jgi:hypothetical protein
VKGRRPLGPQLRRSTDDQIVISLIYDSHLKPGDTGDEGPISYIRELEKLDELHRYIEDSNSEVEK